MIQIFNTVLKNNDLPLIQELTPNLSLTKDLGLDSLMLAELTVRVEDAYGVDVFENGMVHTVGDILMLVDRKNRNN
jgi:acyl carrier protein